MSMTTESLLGSRLGSRAPAAPSGPEVLVPLVVLVVDAGGGPQIVPEGSGILQGPPPVLAGDIEELHRGEQADTLRLRGLGGLGREGRHRALPGVALALRV